MLIRLTKMFDLLLIFFHKGFMLLLLLFFGIFNIVRLGINNALRMTNSGRK